MILHKVLKILLLLFGVVYIALHGFAYQKEATALSSVMLMVLTWLYFKSTENKSLYFFMFLVTFTMAHSLNFITYYTPKIEPGGIDYWYFLNNILYILSYIFLIIKIIKSLNVTKILKEFTIPVIILLVLDVFCVILISDTTEKILTSYEFVLEFVYNGVVMALLSVALINYMYRNDNKSMLFLIGSIFIVFSEIIQLAYFYILDDSNLGLLYAFLWFVAFLFYYMQSQLVSTGPIRIYEDRGIET